MKNDYTKLFEVYFWKPKPSWIIIIFIFISFMMSTGPFAVDGILEGIQTFIIVYLSLSCIWWVIQKIKIYFEKKNDPESVYRGSIQLVEEEANKNPEKAFLLAIAYNEPDDANKNPPYDMCRQNYTKAVYWLKKASEANHTDAMALLGAKYAEGGTGVEKNLDLAKKLLCQAQKIGTSPAGMADMAIKEYNISCD